MQSGEQREDQTSDNNIVEVGNNEVSIVILVVSRRRRKHNPCNSAQYERWDESDRKHVRCRELNGASPQREEPVKDFDTCRYRNEHCCNREQSVSNWP
ncbi:hypothetical protein D9M71_795320 [compost metagenome]